MIRQASTILAILLLMSGALYPQALVGEQRNGYLISGNFDEIHVLTLYLGFRNKEDNEALQECSYEALVMIQNIDNKAEAPQVLKVELAEGGTATLFIKMKNYNRDASSVLLITPEVIRYTGACGLLVNSRLEKEENGYTIISEHSRDVSSKYNLKVPGPPAPFVPVPLP